MKKNYWQSVRGLCILLVILIHTLYFTNSFYINLSNVITRRTINFCVAVFIFIAGYFTKIEKGFYKKKINRIVIPLIIWDVIYTIYFNIINRTSITFTGFVKDLIISSKGIHLYYLYVLIQLFFLAPFLLKVKSSKIKYLPLFITPIYNTLIITLKILYNIDVPLYNYLIFGWISYYYLGLIINDLKVKNIKSLFYLTFLLTIVEGVFLFLYNTQLYNNAISQLTTFNALYSIVICIILYNNYHEKSVDFFTKLGNYSFGIYLSHLLVLQFVKSFYSLINLNYYIYVVVIYITTVAICYFINAFYYEKVRRLLIWKK